MADTTTQSDASINGGLLQLILSTGAFTVCFSVFGTMSALMPDLSRPALLNLSRLEISMAISIPVLLGSLGRIPLGILTDRLGGRIVFMGVMSCSILSAMLLGFADSYLKLLLCGLLLGVSLASFPVGAGHVSGWFSQEKQGTVLGIYGTGNIGQSLAAFGAPLIVIYSGSLSWGFWFFAGLTMVWLLLFMQYAEDAPQYGSSMTLKSFLHPLRKKMSWILSMYYFLTFGGFVAMAIYLPIFLTEEPFKLSSTDAGFRAAGFIVLATVVRPVGGILSDKVGGRKILMAAFPAIAVMAIFMACPLMSTFTIGALGMAIAIGLGNGAVFKLVPEHFPKTVGSVTGLVGAAGGLGGFFPPILLGFIKQFSGTYTLGFVFLSLFALCCLTVCGLIRD